MDPGDYVWGHMRCRIHKCCVGADSIWQEISVRWSVITTEFFRINLKIYLGLIFSGETFFFEDTRSKNSGRFCRIVEIFCSAAKLCCDFTSD